MKNKYLVTVVVPELECEYEVYIPNNKKIGTIKKNILYCLADLSAGIYLRKMEEVRMFDQMTGIEYNNDVYVKDAKIYNGTKIIIM